MKKISMLCVLLLVAAFHAFGQAAKQAVNIADYFSMSVWTRWQYADIHDRFQIGIEQE